MTNHVETPASGQPPGATDGLPAASQAEVSHIATEPAAAEPAAEVGGRGGLEPTRFGDWEKGGRCIDF
jgi:hypothetical protein